MFASLSRWKTGGLLVVGGVLAAMVAWWLLAAGDAPTHASDSLTIPPVALQRVVAASDSRPFALAPDGRFVVYVALAPGQPGRTRLELQRFDGTPPVTLAEGDEPRSPFISPDARWVAFFSGGTIMKVPTAGGAPVAVCACAATAAGGGLWLQDGSIVFRFRERLRLLAPDGRSRRDLTRIPPGSNELAHLAPHPLPGGERILFTVLGVGGGGNVEVLHLATGARTRLVAGGLFGQFTAPDVLSFVDPAGALHAVRIDLGMLRPLGPEAGVDLPPVWTMPTAGSGIEVAPNGVLAYVFGEAPPAGRSLVWVDRQGREEDVALPTRTYKYPRISPRGDLVALDIRDEPASIWIWPVGSEDLRPIATRGRNTYPAWAPDGQALIYNADGDEGDRVIRATIDDPTPVPAGELVDRILPYAVAPDGRTALVRTTVDEVNSLGWLDLAGSSAARTIRGTGPTPVNADLAPDGRWMVFQSADSGRHEIYVQRADGAGPRQQVSRAGGRAPQWAHRGDEILFLGAGQELMRVAVSGAGTSLTFGEPERFFPAGYSSADWMHGTDARMYDLAPDGSRVLAVLGPESRVRRVQAELRVVRHSLQPPPADPWTRFVLWLLY